MDGLPGIPDQKHQKMPFNLSERIQSTEFFRERYPENENPGLPLGSLG